MGLKSIYGQFQENFRAFHKGSGASGGSRFRRSFNRGVSSMLRVASGVSGVFKKFQD